MSEPSRPLGKQLLAALTQEQVEINEPIPLSTINFAASFAFAFESMETMVRMSCRMVISDKSPFPRWWT